MEPPLVSAEDRQLALSKQSIHMLWVLIRTETDPELRRGLYQAVAELQAKVYLQLGIVSVETPKTGTEGPHERVPQEG